jgi:HAE1 family hydrophobic/amphiphilic exporter-1
VCQGYVFVQLQDIAERTFSLGRLCSSALAGDPGAAFRGNFSQRDKMQDIRRRLKELPNLDIAVRNQSPLRQGAPVDIDFSIMGPDLDTLLAFSDELHKKIRGVPGDPQSPGVPGIVDTYNTMRFDRLEVVVDIDRERAGALGVDAKEIAETLRVAVGGDDRASRYRDIELGEVYDVELRLVGMDRADPEAIGQLYVRTRPGLAVGTSDPMPPLDGAREEAAGHTRVDNVVDFRFVDSPQRIDRLDRQRMAAVRANVAPGYALADRIQAIQAAAEEIGLPPGVTTRVVGRGRELERTFRDFRWTFVLSFIFMYLLLAAQFEHVSYPLTILFSLPLAVPFGLVSLWLGGETLNLYSALGILVLFGVVKKAAILQVDHTNQLRRRGMERLPAILQANRDRLRPILMTTIAFVAGMLPLLTGSGPGSEERRSIAVLAVGGQTLSLLLTLVAVPVVYSFLDDVGAWYLRVWRRIAGPVPGESWNAGLPGGKNGEPGGNGSELTLAGEREGQQV